MKKKIHYAFILDQSGSMSPLKHEVISGFNEQVDSILKLKKNNPETEIKVTLCMFNDLVEFGFINKPVNDLKPLSENDYVPGFCTALFDAIGATFKKISEHIKPSDKVFIAIFTDGLENASTDYSAEEVQKILAQSTENNWETKFFCSNKDNLFYKTHLNLEDDNIFNITLDEPGIKSMKSEICYKLQKLIHYQWEESKPEEWEK